jgi:hypothetical protein
MDSLVALQVLISEESHITERAGKWFLSRMCLQVSIEVIRRREVLFTLGAGEYFSTMNILVILKALSLRERHITVGAVKAFPS